MRERRESQQSTRNDSDLTRPLLDTLYATYNRREYVHPDPLEFLYRYPNHGDREIVGLLASSLAYGRVQQILNSVTKVLGLMGVAPREFVLRTQPDRFESVFSGIKHRFTDASHLSALMRGVQRMMREYGSLNKAFLAGHDATAETVLPAMDRFSAALGLPDSYLVPAPASGSACKRFCLFLRWMVRKDDVDPGGWTGVSPAQLIVPMDTHMAGIAGEFGLTRKKSVNRAMAIEVTQVFAKFCPDDPVRYDFALTRFGIHPEVKKGRRTLSEPRISTATSSTVESI
jgi:uncharacterized protein (TIGR02757 family)